MRSSHRIQFIVILSLIVLSNAGRAEDAFYRVPIKDLKLTEGKLPEYKAADFWTHLRGTIEAGVRLDDSNAADTGEAYLHYLEDHRRPAGAWVTGFNTSDTAVVLRAPVGKDITGRLYVPAEDWKSLVALRFSIPASAADPKARESFFHGKQQHYEDLQEQNIPGAAWFRHQAREAGRALGKDAKENNRLPINGTTRGDFEDTYSLFSGGRAVSENLQLDRVLLPRAGSTDANVAIDTLEGITVKEMDWKPLIDGKQPATDPLAALIPVDQHAIFFSTFDAAMTLMEEADRQGTPVLQYAEPRSEDGRTKQRYQRQLCLPLTGLGRLLV
jgi:hypothetical protein